MEHLPLISYCHPVDNLVAFDAMLGFSSHGWREMLLGSMLLLSLGACLSWVWWPLGILVLPFVWWLFYFFRDPDRAPPDDVNAWVSPADGTVSDIKDVDLDLLGGPCVRVGIFLSVFNVHVNRSPCDGHVGTTIYNKGKFISALNHDKASSDNESNTFVIENAQREPIAVVKQIAGLIARRIVFTPAPFEAIARGQRVGLIKFGSRTELYIPKKFEPEITVKVGDKLQGGGDIIARVPLCPGVVHKPHITPAPVEATEATATTP
jgi:phosphatidylserine decarboxylase